MVKGIPSIVVPCSEPSSPNDSDDTQDGGGEVGAWGWGWGGRSENKDEVEDRREDLWQDTAPPRHALFPDWPSAHAICIPLPDWWQVEALFCIKLNQGGVSTYIKEKSRRR